jgi:hypothetical protein
MPVWKEMGESFKSLLRLRTEPVAFRRLEKAEELEKVPNVVRVKRGFTYCQVPFLVRVLDRAISGIRKLGKIGFKCPIAFIGGLADPAPILAQLYPNLGKK